MKQWMLAALLLSQLVACAAIPTPQERQDHADALATPWGWQASHIPSGRFNLVAYAPHAITPAETLTVYIEGDGFAWVTGSTPSVDPTPREPQALKLALVQPAGNAAYLARPCQYVDAQRTGCPQRYWTEARFASEVVAASSKAIDVLKERFGATHLTLVGYSGGATVAALLASRRVDVERLITVAGNLDHRAWTTYHRVVPLIGSLNPADEIDTLRHVRQWHFAGGEDRVIPAALTLEFVERFAPAERPTVQVMPGFNHQCCWVEQWPSIWHTIDR